MSGTPVPWLVEAERRDFGRLAAHGPGRIAKDRKRLTKRGLRTRLATAAKPPPATFPPKPFQRQFAVTRLPAPPPPWTLWRPENAITLSTTTVSFARGPRDTPSVLPWMWFRAMTVRGVFVSAMPSP